MIDEKYSLSHLDLSWAKLSPKHLNQIIKTYLEKESSHLRHLNLSYNSLIKPPLDENISFDETNPELQASREFVANLCEFIDNSMFLNFLDLSGMNLATD